MDLLSSNSKGIKTRGDMGEILSIRLGEGHKARRRHRADPVNPDFTKPCGFTFRQEMKSCQM
jgi:hypothetical protein